MIFAFGRKAFTSLVRGRLIRSIGKVSQKPFEFGAFAGSLGLFLSILKRLRSDEFGINSYLQECEFPPDLPT